MPNNILEVSRGRSTRAKRGRTKLIVPRLDPQYIVGFVDGEGSFCVSISRHKTLRRRVEVRCLFEIELRADDQNILERIQQSFGCGSVYHLAYKRYDWYPHAKYKVSSINDLFEIIVPFFEQHMLQAKKKEVFSLFCKAVSVVKAKRHLTDQGFQEILEIRERMREFSKKHYRNR